MPTSISEKLMNVLSHNPGQSVFCVALKAGIPLKSAEKHFRTLVTSGRVFKANGVYWPAVKKPMITRRRVAAQGKDRIELRKAIILWADSLMSQIGDKRWATVNEVSRESKIPVSTIRSWCQRGKIPCSRRGGDKTWFIDIFEMLTNNPSDQTCLAVEVILGRKIFTHQSISRCRSTVVDSQRRDDTT